MTAFITLSILDLYDIYFFLAKYEPHNLDYFLIAFTCLTSRLLGHYCMAYVGTSLPSAS